MARHCTNGQSVHSLARCQPWASRSIVFASRVSLAEMAVSRRVSAGETRPASPSRRQTVTTLGLSWTRFGGPSPARLHHALTPRVMRGFASIVLFEPGPCRAQECKGVTTRSALPEVLCAMLLPAPPTVPGSDLPGARAIIRGLRWPCDSAVTGRKLLSRPGQSGRPGRGAARRYEALANYRRLNTWWKTGPGRLPCLLRCPAFHLASGASFRLAGIPGFVPLVPRWTATEWGG